MKGKNKMGQYHKLVNLDKKEMVHPYNLGLGAKQYEQTGDNGSLSDAIYLLVMTSPARGGGDWESFADLSGRWAGDRVVVLGDYTEDEDLPDIPNASKLYSESATSEDWTDISDEVAVALGKVFGFEIDTEENGWRTRNQLEAHWLNAL
jgi:hypothetical protein